MSYRTQNVRFSHPCNISSFNQIAPQTHRFFCRSAGLFCILLNRNRTFRVRGKTRLHLYNHTYGCQSASTKNLKALRWPLEAAGYKENQNGQPVLKLDVTTMFLLCIFLAKKSRLASNRQLFLYPAFLKIKVKRRTSNEKI